MRSCSLSAPALQIRIQALDGSCTIFAGSSGYRPSPCPPTGPGYVSYDTAHECLYSLQGISLSRDGASLYAAVGGDSRVARFDISRGSVTTVTASLSTPVAVAQAADGFLLVVDAGLNAVVRVAQNGTWWALLQGSSAGSPGGGPPPPSYCSPGAPTGLGSLVPVSSSAICLTNVTTASSLALLSDGLSFIIADSGEDAGRLG